MRLRRRHVVGSLLLTIIVIALPLTVFNAQKIQHQAVGGGNALYMPPPNKESNPGTQTAPQVAGSSKALYVSPSGRDSNPGTKTAPFATIDKADNVATPGTAIHVAPGT